ncbi:MAG: GNAT family N-acetyltransferase [Caulobacteraceae bacterium]|nr:GNAT family N-acetyltransferase [Caulobacteraceae bacterium]
MIDININGEMTIRPATPRDAERLTQLGRQTFVDKFGHLYPPEDLADFLATAHTPEKYAAWASDPAYGLWIVERGETAIAYALAGPCHLPHPDVTPDCGELCRIYVLAEAQGAGLGGRLLTLALDWLERSGRTLWIGVWSENLGAQRLYARYGFEKAGEYEFPVGATRDQEFILRRAAP